MLVASVSLSNEPALKRIRSEVLLHHEVGDTIGGKAIEPGHEQFVECFFANAHGWIGPDELDRAPTKGGLGLIGGENVPRERGPLQILCREFACALVDIHAPHLGPVCLVCKS